MHCDEEILSILKYDINNSILAVIYLTEVKSFELIQVRCYSYVEIFPHMYDYTITI